jgi:uncharacterized protein (DUF58 family)
VTPRGITLLVGAVLVVATGRLLGIAELYVVGAAAAALVVVSVLAARLASATVAARRSASRRLLVGAEGDVRLELRNESRLPAALLLVEDRCHPSLAPSPRFVVSGLRPGRTLVLTYPIAGTVRGRYPTGPLVVRVRDPFGLAERVRRYTATSEVLVYPKVEPLGPGPVRGQHRGSGASEKRRLYAAGDEFYTMREYVQGDDLRQVHWPSTAHRQKLMVRQQEMPWQAEATVLCDTRAAAHVGVGADSTLEKAVSVAASMLWHLAERAYTLRLVTAADTRPAGAEPWEVLLERLAELRASRVATLVPALTQLAEGGEGLLVAVLAPPPGAAELTSSSDVRALLQAGRGYGGRVALVTYDPGRRTSAERARAFVHLLANRGWKAATVAVDESLAGPWSALARTRVPGTVRAARQEGAQ